MKCEKKERLGEAHMSARVPVQRFDDRTLLIALLRTLHGEGYSLWNIETKLSRIAPIDPELLRGCLTEIGIGEPANDVSPADATRRRIARYVR